MTATCVVAAAGLVFAGAANAQSATDQDRNFAVGAHVGTPGVGVDASLRLGSHFVVRGAGDWAGISHDETYHNIPYRGHLHETTGGAFIDYHPFANAFLLSAGGYFGTRKLDIDATPAGNVNIGGATFTPAEVGRLTGQVRQSSAQPFVGLGFDNTFHTRSRWSFSGVLGVSFSGSPSVTLNSTGGTLSSNAIFQTNLANERATIANDTRNYKYDPIATIGIHYAF